MKLLITLLLVLSANAAFAGQDTGGGDSCENRIMSIRDDIKDWIQKGGSNNLVFSDKVTSDHYSQVMLAEIKNAKIRCVGEGDEGYPVNIEGTAKVCRYDKSANSQITCDYKKFQGVSESDQYVLVHHEFAGLAGIELPNGDISSYALSNQISGYLEDQIVKKLVVKPSPTNESDKKGFLVLSASKTPYLLYYYVSRCLKFNSNGKTENDCVEFDKTIKLIFNRDEPLLPGTYFVWTNSTPMRPIVVIKPSERTILKATSLSQDDLVMLNKNFEQYFHPDNTYVTHEYTFFIEPNYSNIKQKLFLEEQQRILFQRQLLSVDDNFKCGSKVSLSQIIEDKKLQPCPNDPKVIPLEISDEAQRYLDLIDQNSANGYYINYYDDEGHGSPTQLKLSYSSTSFNYVDRVYLSLENSAARRETFRAKFHYDTKEKIKSLLPGSYIITIYEGAQSDQYGNDTYGTGSYVATLPFQVK
jgi:hypothetical protein